MSRACGRCLWWRPGLNVSDSRVRYARTSRWLVRARARCDEASGRSGKSPPPLRDPSLSFYAFFSQPNEIFFAVESRADPGAGHGTKNPTAVWQFRQFPHRQSGVVSRSKCGERKNLRQTALQSLTRIAVPIAQPLDWVWCDPSFSEKGAVGGHVPATDLQHTHDTRLHVYTHAMDGPSDAEKLPVTVRTVAPLGSRRRITRVRSEAAVASPIESRRRFNCLLFPTLSSPFHPTAI